MMTDQYNPWGGNDADSSAGRQLSGASEDAMRVYGEDWPDRLASALSSIIEDPETLQLVADLIGGHAELWNQLDHEAEHDTDD